MSGLAHAMNRVVSNIGEIITYTTLDTNKKAATARLTLSGDLLTAEHISINGVWDGVLSIQPLSGKMYFEVTVNNSRVSAGSLTVIGIRNSTDQLIDYPFEAGDSGFWYYGDTGDTYKGLTPKACGSLVAINDVVGIAYDDSVGVWISINGVWQNVTAQTDPENGLNPQYTIIEMSGTLYALIALENGGIGTESSYTCNFGSSAWNTTPPNGFTGIPA